MTVQQPATAHPSGSGTELSPVVVVTGGGGGIGAAIAETFGRGGWVVVTVDPGVDVEGTTTASDPATATTTTQRIAAAGGTGRASNASVTDLEALEDLFAGLVSEFGRLDAVINVAGITRVSSFARGDEAAWTALLDVHVNGYLNVLRAALPIMAEAGRGQVLGVTSGSGWRPANAGAYGCAKRAVASLTWQLGPLAPNGVAVNALSPIAATRMVAHGNQRRSTSPAGTSGTGGLSVSANMPPPEHLGPIGAYLAGEAFTAWCSGQVMFSNGSEVTWVVPPQLLEVVSTSSAQPLPQVLDTVLPGCFAPAEQQQSTTGGTNPRFAPTTTDDTAAVAATTVGTKAAVVADDATLGAEIARALEARGFECIDVGRWSEGSAEPTAVDWSATAQLDRAARRAGTLDAVVVAAGAPAVPTPASAAAAQTWRTVLDDHVGIVGSIAQDGAWARAVADYAGATQRAVRLVTVTPATSPGGRTRANSVAQLARSAHAATRDLVDAFAISVESASVADSGVAAELAAHLACHPDASSLSGAELVVGPGWFGMRSHPAAHASVSYGGPEIPDWFDDVLSEIVHGTTNGCIPRSAANAPRSST